MIDDEPERGLLRLRCIYARPYALPDPLRSAEDAMRASHADLAALSDLDLWAEGQRALVALIYADAGSDRDWLQARRGAVEEERARRARQRRPSPRGGR